jgi:hypothetical protein
MRQLQYYEPVAWVKMWVFSFFDVWYIANSQKNNIFSFYSAASTQREISPYIFQVNYLKQSSSWCYYNMTSQHLCKYKFYLICVLLSIMFPFIFLPFCVCLFCLDKRYVIFYSKEKKIYTYEWGTPIVKQRQILSLRFF